MTLRINITRRTRRREGRDGTVKPLERYVVNFRDPKTGRRHQLFFDRKKDAEAHRDTLVADYQLGTSVSPQRASVTVSGAVERWLAHRQGQIRERTLRAYRTVVPCIVGPLIRGTPAERRDYTLAVRKPAGVEFLPTLGHVKVKDLTTAAIRDWHRMLWQEVGGYTANRARSFLKTALALAGEDFSLRPPAMPTHLGLRRTKVKKFILAPEQVSALLAAARADTERGIYIAFPFLAGTRPSEQLGLLWPEVDFEKNVIRICRTQADRGELVEATKTEAGAREIPMGPILRQMLLEWRVRCPRLAGELYRVFPGLGRLQAWPKPRLGAGGALEYHNYRSRVWAPFFKKREFPYVTPHSARHAYISVLQMQGIEVALVAKIVGHANANVTLGHYSQAVRGSEAAAAALEKAYLPG